MKCLKCQHELFDRDVAVATTLDMESKKRGEYKFEVLTCKNCGLAQWYDFYIASGTKGPAKQPGRSKYKAPELAPFKCLNCGSDSAALEVIAPLVGAGAKEFDGDILARICRQCGLAELYEIILSFSGSAWLDVDKRARIASVFICPNCRSSDVDKTGHTDFSSIVSQRIKISFLSRIPTSFIFCTCRNCKYMMLFHVK